MYSSIYCTINIDQIPIFSSYRDAWNRLGDMSCESAMAAYVDEMKKVAQEVSNAYFVISFVQILVNLSLPPGPTKSHTNTTNVFFFYCEFLWGNL